jgi:hypothetical protein
MGTSVTATFTAGQVIFENTLGSGTVPTLPPVAGTTLAVNAIDVLGPKTGFSNAQITLGAGAVTLTGFGAVDLRSTGQIVATGNGGSLTVESPLTLDAPRIGAGTLGTDANGVTKLNTVAYAITAVDNPANPGTYYPITFTNSSGTTPPLPPALLGSSLTVTGSSVTINTDVALPGGTFTANAGGNIVVGPQGVIDVSGQAVEFVDVLATIGGGAINLTSASGGISIQAGAVLNVGDLADAGALNQTSAGTLTLSAPTGGVTVAPGTLQGQGMTADTSGSFALDTNALSPTSAQTYDALAAALVAGGFNKSWDIRARSGDIFMTGLTRARNRITKPATKPALVREETKCRGGGDRGVGG